MPGPNLPRLPRRKPDRGRDDKDGVNRQRPQPPRVRGEDREGGKVNRAHDRQQEDEADREDGEEDVD